MFHSEIVIGNRLKSTKLRKTGFGKNSSPLFQNLYVNLEIIATKNSTIALSILLSVSKEILIKIERRTLRFF